MAAFNKFENGRMDGSGQNNHMRVSAIHEIPFTGKFNYGVAYRGTCHRAWQQFTDNGCRAYLEDRTPNLQGPRVELPAASRKPSSPWH
jgi:hypothetical protein